MPNQGAWTNTPTGNGKVTIPAGYHNGSGYVDTSAVDNTGFNDGKANGIQFLGTTTGGTFNATGVTNYNTLTADNFLLVVENIPATTIKSTSSYSCFSATGGIYSTFTISKSYDANTGTLTYPASILCFGNVINGDGGNNYATGYAQIVYSVYLVL